MSEERPKPLRVPIEAVPRRSAMTWSSGANEERGEPTVPSASEPPLTASSEVALDLPHDATRVERPTIIDDVFEGESTEPLVSSTPAPKRGSLPPSIAPRARAATVVEQQRPEWLDDMAAEAVQNGAPRAPTPTPTEAPDSHPLPPEETSPSLEVKLDGNDDDEDDDQGFSGEPTRIQPSAPPMSDDEYASRADSAAPVGLTTPAKEKRKSASAVVIRGMVRVSEFPEQPSEPPVARAEFGADETPFDVRSESNRPESTADDLETADVPDPDALPPAPRLPDAELLIASSPVDEPSVEIEIEASDDDEDELDPSVLDEDEADAEDIDEVMELEDEVPTPRHSAPPPPPAGAPPQASPAVVPPASPASSSGPAAPPPGPAAAAPPKAPDEPRRRPWYHTFFNDDYLRTVQPPVPKHVEREVDFIERALDLAPGATILDVACGLGLHAMELSRRGYTVAAIDASEPMLARARDEAKDLGLNVQFLHGDMLEMAFDISFDAVICWGTSFGYFDDEKNRQVIQRFHQALKPRGVLLLDVVNRDHVIEQQPNLVWFEGDGCVCMEESKFNYFHSRLQVKRTVILDDGRQRENGYSIRLYSAHELGKLMHLQGFRVAEFSGRIATPGVFFGAASPRMMIVAERRGNTTKTIPEIPAAEGPKSTPATPPATPPDALSSKPPEASSDESES